MAVNVLSENAQALSLLFTQPYTDQINWSTPMLKLIPWVAGNGKSCNFTTKFTGQANAAGQAEGARLAYTDAGKEIEEDGVLAWKEYTKVASISGKNKAAVRATARTQSADSLIGGLSTLEKSRLRDSYGRLLKGLEAHVFSSTGAGGDAENITGLVSAVDATGTYATIAQGTYSEWASTEAAASLGDLSFAQIEEDLLTPIYNACGEQPTFLMTDAVMWARIKALYGSAAVPFINEVELPSISNAGGMSAPSRTLKLRAGTEGFLINGSIPVLRAPDAQTNTVWALNTKYLYMAQLLEDFEDLMDPSAVAEIVSSALDKAITPQLAAEIAGLIRNPRGIIPQFKRLGATGISDETAVFAFPQLVCERRNAQGKLVYS